MTDLLQKSMGSLSGKLQPLKSGLCLAKGLRLIRYSLYFFYPSLKLCKHRDASRIAKKYLVYAKIPAEKRWQFGEFHRHLSTVYV